MIKKTYPLLCCLAMMWLFYSCKAQPAVVQGEWPERETNAYDSTGHLIFPLNKALEHPEKVYRISAVYWNEGQLPDDIDRFVNLKELHIQFSAPTVLPDALWNLKGLTSLGLMLKSESHLPDRLGELQHLKRLLVYNSDLPSSVGRLKNLEELSVGYYQKLPEQVWGLTQLTALYFWGDQLKELPLEIGNMTRLRTLSICSSSITSLPDTIGNLQNLERLVLTQNHLLHSFPRTIARLKKLEFLEAYSSAFTTLPPEIGELSSLAILRLDNFADDTVSSFSQIPPEIGRLTQLHELSLNHHQLASLPREIGNLKQLTTLHLSHNKLSTLPPEIGQLENLMFLELEGNPVKTFPKEIAKLQYLNTFEFDTAGIPLNTYPDEMCAMRSFPFRLIAHVPKSIAGKPLNEWLKRNDIDTLSRLYVQRKLHMKKKRLTKILDHVLQTNPGNEAFYFYLFNELIQYSRGFDNDTIATAYNTHSLNFQKWDISTKVCQVISNYFVKDPCKVFKQVKYGRYKKAYPMWQYYAWLGLGEELETLEPKIRQKLMSCGKQYLKDWKQLLQYMKDLSSVEEGD